MPTETTEAADAALFLFAHPDDEFGVWQTMLDCMARGLRVRCAYFTTSATASLSARRAAESRRVLGALGVAPDDIVFPGAELAILDASLPHRLAPAAAWLAQWCRQAGTPRLLCVPAWEGGHQDHDALHALAVETAHAAGLLACVRQYALYHSAGLPPPLFRVLRPLAANGAVERTRIPWRNRLRFCRYCVAYPSQLMTWIGLFPCVLWHYLRRGEQTLQAVSIARTLERPHAGALYYEQRKFFTWPQMQQLLASWRASRPGDVERRDHPPAPRPPR
ncbi:N-acetylglucosaminylphosphatidylinositol deacetylase [Duganella sp. Leaf126]|uniref:PIG-L deacetylase family protein n=1 Tax=Duganella sp. Leaf126 TaxID=1736266 RepID=UPI0006F86FBA|nr:PIG-L family deacetylase [Duganella sp. Leaf126]KQQ33673.1 N-acetylglucosaminylphosphatidylinositol deacetylase [Duganella sp. Leaf126]